MIAYVSRSATEHRTRWAKAVEKVWDWAAFDGWSGEIPDTVDRPGIHDENVFDFHDGLRLIASMDRYGERGTYLHVSASFKPESPLWEKVRSGKVDRDAALKLIQERVLFISGVSVTFGYFTPGKQVPHFFYPPLQEVAE
jgi:hypothetical protein